jgi:hypothetical protein
MPTYKAPVDDVRFLLNDVFHIDRYANLPGFSDASPDVVDAILGEAAKLCEQVLTPLNRIGDKEGCKRGADGSVTTPTGFKDAFKQIVDGGWIGISAPPEFGGQGLPMLMTQIVNEFLCSANMAFAMYPGLTQGAIAALIAHGSAEQKAAYLPKMIAGEWTGTMNLTEPHCGTDLGLLAPRRRSRPTAATRSPAPRSSSRPASTISRQHRPSGAGAHRRRARGHRGISLFVCPNSCRSPMARSARATRCPAARSKRRWAFTRQRHLRHEL